VIITITPPGGTAFVLANDTIPVVSGSGSFSQFLSGAGGMQREGLASKQKRVLQRSQCFRSPYSFNAMRFNLENSFSVTTQRSFSDPETCLAFVRSHADTVPTIGEITVTETSATGTANAYLPNAFIENVETSQHQDIGAITRYSIVGGGPWQTTP
jgi:hypothetical protein